MFHLQQAMQYKLQIRVSEQCSLAVRHVSHAPGLPTKETLMRSGKLSIQQLVTRTQITRALHRLELCCFFFSTFRHSLSVTVSQNAEAKICSNLGSNLQYFGPYKLCINQYYTVLNISENYNSRRVQVAANRESSRTLHRARVLLPVWGELTQADCACYGGWEHPERR